MWKWILGALLAFLVVIIAFEWQRVESAVSVATVSVSRGSVDSRLLLTGTVINDRTVTLTALLDGEIIAMKAREGDVVEAEQVLAEVDSRQARAMLDRSSAEMVLKEQTVQASTRNLERLKRISRAGNASRQSLDDSEDELLDANAELHAAKANFRLNKLRVENAEIRSPFAGTVIEKSAETGQWLEAGTPLFKVVAKEGTVIEAAVSASDWSRIRIGQPVTLSTDSISKIQWNSEINWIAPTVVAVNGEGRNVAVRIPLSDDAPPLLLGQEVDVDVSLQRVDDVLVVPLDVLQEIEAGVFTARVLVGNTVRIRPITVGLTSLGDAEVIEGLSEGETLIDPQGQDLQDGQVVRVRGLQPAS